jgi:hypothetical protein
LIARHAIVGLALIALGAASLLALPASAMAAGAPQITAIWTTGVKAAGATFQGEINPQGLSTTYRFEYLTDEAYQANIGVGEDPFTGAANAPSAGNPPSAGAGSSPVTVARSVSALRASTLYHYRLTATNSSGTTIGSEASFLTQEFGGGPLLLDARRWELVSPPEKNGGAVQRPEQIHGGGVIEAAATGYPSASASITYSSASSFGKYEALGAPPASQYISRRSESGWATENISAPAVSGSYGNEPNGVPYQLFSTDLARGLMLNGIHCRGEGTACPVANPPLPGSGAPEGFQDYYLRANQDGTYTATITESNAELGPEPEEFDLAFAGASPDLSHLVLSTCAALTPEATEQPVCESGGPNLYEWSAGTLRIVNLLEGNAHGSSDAHLAAQSGAISSDGSRIYFTQGEQAALYLREGEAGARLVSEGSSFQTASSDGSVAYYTKEEGGSGKHLYRYEAIGEQTTDLTPSGGVKGVLGASEEGSTVYYQDSSGLEEWHEGAFTQVAFGPEAAQPSDYPPTTGTARVSPDGSRLLFLSKESLTGYDNHDATTGQPDSEVFLWDATGGLVCISCNRTGERPLGPSTIAGAYSNGASPGSTDSYRPRNLSATEDRAFFDSDDSLVSRDTNKASDAYEWEAQGVGSCTKPIGCLALISSGIDPEGATFLDASEAGADAYFLTFSSLVNSDPGSADVYDARVEGGFTEPLAKIPCKGDACVPLPQGPEDPSVGSLIPGLSNPTIHFPNLRKCPKGKRTAVRHGEVVCLRKHRSKHGKHHKRRLRRRGSR